jgi:hypothetical protein
MKCRGFEQENASPSIESTATAASVPAVSPGKAIGIILKVIGFIILAVCHHCRAYAVAKRCYSASYRSLTDAVCRSCLCLPLCRFGEVIKLLQKYQTDWKNNSCATCGFFIN